MRPLCWSTSGRVHGEALYYQINYRTYGPGRTVETFAMDQLAQNKEKLAPVQERLLTSGVNAAKDLKEVGFAGPLAARNDAGGCRSTSRELYGRSA